MHYLKTCLFLCNKTKFAFTLVITLFSIGCSTRMAFVAPTPDTANPAVAEKSSSSVPVFRLGDSPEMPYRPTGHVFTAFSSGLPDTIPLNDSGPLPAEALNNLTEVARKAGADAVVGVQQVGFYGWIHAGQGVSGIAVEFTDEADTHNTERSSEFIACLMPVLIEGKNENFDESIRIKGRHFLTSKGYYVYTPEKTTFDGNLGSLSEMTNGELDEICGHESDLFVFFHKDRESDKLSLSAFSKKNKLFVDNGETSKRSKGLAGAAGFVSGGLIGLAGGVWAASVSASESDAYKLIDLLPTLPKRCSNYSMRQFSPKIECTEKN